MSITRKDRVLIRPTGECEEKKGVKGEQREKELFTSRLFCMPLLDGKHLFELFSMVLNELV